MSRKKDGKSLLEVMGVGASQGGKSMDVPSWFDRGEQPSPPDVPGGAASGGLPGETSKVQRSVSPPVVPSGRREPILSVSDGRLIISLNQISALVVILAIILLGVGAYMLGRRTSQTPGGQTPPNRNTTQSGDGPVKGSPVSPDKSKPDESGMVRDDAPRQKGYSYLVIQGGIDTLKEARDIKRFLHGKGIDATIHRMSIRKYMVKDMRGFKNIRSSEQTRAAIREHVAQMERLGREYLRQGGRRDFRQSSATGAWMITER